MTNSINIARRERYKFFTTKIYSKERTVIKTTLKTFNLCSSYYGRSRYFFDGHKLPARANGTKREAIWYNELYLLEKVSKTESTEVMNYVVFSMPHGEI